MLSNEEDAWGIGIDKPLAIACNRGMAKKAQLVNLDAMIPRSDFAIQDADASGGYDKFPSLGIRDLIPTGLIRHLLRKPDFQRETNHWNPEQIASLLKCFVNGDLIPAVIVWKSPSSLFVIDGGHRLSAIMAWLDDDYGDGIASTRFFGTLLSREQIKAAEKTRALVKAEVGSWKMFQANLESKDASEDEKKRVNTAISRGITVQWVEGNVEKAESSFFKINTKGTPLDQVEELLLSNRRKPIAIASRAVIRAGKGHRYWSNFEGGICEEIETLSKQVHQTLFQPELSTPVKTLDLPLGGSTGVRAALQVLIDFMLAASHDQLGRPRRIEDQEVDGDGSATREALRKALTLSTKITGNDRGSLGLHPAIYFYGPTGRHLIPMFLGISTLISRKLVNNDKAFFTKFTSVRSRLEEILIVQKDLIATILQRTISKYRVEKYAELIDTLVQKLASDSSVVISETDLVAIGGLAGKIIVGTGSKGIGKFSEEVKSAAFIMTALKSAVKCPICNGYLDSGKSVSYDHIQESAAGGGNSLENCQLTHPFCNQAMKNRAFQRA